MGAVASQPDAASSSESRQRSRSGSPRTPRSSWEDELAALADELEARHFQNRGLLEIAASHSSACSSTAPALAARPLSARKAESSAGHGVSEVVPCSGGAYHSHLCSNNNNNNDDDDDDDTSNHNQKHPYSKLDASHTFEKHVNSSSSSSSSRSVNFTRSSANHEPSQNKHTKTTDDSKTTDNTSRGIKDYTNGSSASERRCHSALDMVDTCIRLAEEVTRLQQALESSERRADQAETKVRMWEELFGGIASIFLLGPEMLENYKRTLTKELKRALQSLAMIDEVQNLTCSFPAVPSEHPRPRLRRYGGELDSPMEWDIDWVSAAWTVNISVSGRLYGIGFSLHIRLHHPKISGCIRVLAPRGGVRDLSEFQVSFKEIPQVDFCLDSQVAWGIVPLPIRAQVDARVRSSLEQFLRAELVDPKYMVVKANSLKPKHSLSDLDVQTAIEDAEWAKKQLGVGHAPRTWD